MSTFLRNAMSSARDLARRFRQRVDPPLGENASPIEIRRAILDCLERRLEPIGSGRLALPGDRVVVEIVARDSRQLDSILAVLKDDAMSRLRELGVVLPPRFHLEVRSLDRQPAAWSTESRFDVTFESGKGVRAAMERSTMPVLQIDVTAGKASKARYTFVESTLRIGRTEMPTDELGRRMKNHIAFIDDDSAENKTVTRRHAEIRYHTDSGDYRLFDLGSANGTMIVRSGNSIIVPPNDPIGLAINSGDEIHIGRAILKARIGAQRTE